MEEKPFKSLSEQIEILKSRGLIFIDEPTDSLRLSSDGYYEIINGYKSTFLQEKEEEKFKEGTFFRDIYGLFQFDCKIRNSVMEGLEYAEGFLRQKLAYTLAEQHSENFEDYISHDVFNAGKKLPNRKQNPKHGIYTERDYLFRGLEIIANLKYDPYLHYQDKYSNTPPWILVKGMTLGQLRMCITLLNEKDKSLLIQRVYRAKYVESMKSDDLLRLFSETLVVINKYRNRAAHGGRMYNYFPDVGFTYTKELHDIAKISKTQITKKKLHSSSLNLLQSALAMWNSGDAAIAIVDNIVDAIQDYEKSWPDHVEFIVKEMELENDYQGFMKQN